MRTRPYLYSLLAGVAGLGFFVSQIKPIPPTIKIDPRLNAQMVESLTGLYFSPQFAPVLAGFDLGPKLPIEPPALYFGFDRPSAEMKSAPFLKNHYQLVAAFHSLHAPLKSLDDLPVAFRESTIYTDDKFLYARFQGDFPNLKFKEDTNAILKEIASNENTVAFLNIEKITPKVRSLSAPLGVSIWIGWKKSSFPFADRLGLNSKLDEALQNLLKNAQPQTEPSSTRIVAVGDIMLARAIGKRLSTEIKQQGETNYPFGEMLDVLKNADITIGNLECAISSKGTPMPGKDYTFRAPPNATRQLTAAGFDIVTLGNNHSKDYGSDALIDTLDHLKKSGIATIGAGRNRSEAREFKVITTKDGTRVGFLGYTMILPRNFLAEAKTPGVAWAKEKGLANDIKAAKASCDVLMVQYHWGTEYTVNPTKAQRILAHKTIDLGADIVVGHHPHWIQEVEFYKGKFIAYSLGNFVFDMNHRPKVTEGMIVTCEIRNKKISQIHCDPVSIKSGEPEIISWEVVAKRDRATIMKEIYIASGFLKPSPDTKLASAK